MYLYLSGYNLIQIQSFVLVVYLLAKNILGERETLITNDYYDSYW